MNIQLQSILRTSFVFSLTYVCAFTYLFSQTPCGFSGSVANSFYGWSVATSESGRVSVAGAPFYSNRGSIRIHEQLGSSNITSPTDGEAFGWSVDVSENGNHIIVGAPHYNNFMGRVYIFEKINGGWLSLGDPILGEIAGEEAGNTVSISKNGTRIAIGTVKSINSSPEGANVRIMEWNGTSWEQLGNDIIPEAAGYSKVYLSNDGTRIAIGFQTASTSSINDHIKVYDWNGNDWEQLGAIIINDASEEQFGYALALAESNPARLVVGAHKNNDNGTQTGKVTVFEYQTALNEWQALGPSLQGENNYDFFGYSVDINHEGSTILVGAPGLHSSSSTNGYVNMYQYNSSNNQWELYEVPLECDLDSGSLTGIGSAVALPQDQIFQDEIVVGAPYDTLDSKGSVQINNVDLSCEENTIDSPLFHWSKFNPIDYELQATSDDGVLLSSTSNLVHTKLTADGKEQWSFQNYKRAFPSLDGNFLLAKQDTLTKIDPDGNILWKKYIDDLDFRVLIVETEDNGLVYVKNDNNIVKLDANDAVEWEYLTLKYTADLGKTLDGGYFIYQTETSGNTAQTTSQSIRKLDANGNSLWSTVIGVSYDPIWQGSTFTLRTIPSHDGGFIVHSSVLVSTTLPTGEPVLRPVARISKLDANGDISWSMDYDLSDNIKDIQVLSDGSTVIFGNKPITDRQQTYLTKINTSGDIIWDNIYNTLFVEEAAAFALAQDGGFVLTGSTAKNLGDINVENTSIDMFVRKVNEEGTIQWQNNYGQYGEDIPNHILTSSNGHIVVSGYTTSRTDYLRCSVDGNHYWTFKISGDGTTSTNEIPFVEENSIQHLDNYPNPFYQETTIRFSLSLASNYEIIIFDTTGKVLKQINGYGQKGLNEHAIHFKEMTPLGILFYQLKTPESMYVQKMICLND